jgi:hypothetical protein
MPLPEGLKGYFLHPISKFRVYFSVNNPFTFSKYKGFDPAATSGNAVGGGIDPGFYPVTRQYLLGLNISF